MNRPAEPERGSCAGSLKQAPMVRRRSALHGSVDVLLLLVSFDLPLASEIVQVCWQDRNYRKHCTFGSSFALTSINWQDYATLSLAFGLQQPQTIADQDDH